MDIADFQYRPEYDAESMFIFLLAKKSEHFYNPLDGEVETPVDLIYPVLHAYNTKKQYKDILVRILCPTTVQNQYPNWSPYIEKAIVLISVFSPRNHDVDSVKAETCRGWIRQILQDKNLWHHLNEAGTEYSISKENNSIILVGSDSIDSDPEWWQRNLTVELPLFQDHSK